MNGDRVKLDVPCFVEPWSAWTRGLGKVWGPLLLDIVSLPAHRMQWGVETLVAL